MWIRLALGAVPVTFILDGRCALRLLKLSAFEDHGPMAMTVARHRTAVPAPAPVTLVAVRRAPLATTAAAARPADMPGMPLPFALALLPDETIRPRDMVAGLRRVLGRDLEVVVAAVEARTGRTLLTIAPGNATADRRTGPARAVPAGQTVSRETAM